MAAAVMASITGGGSGHHSSGDAGGGGGGEGSARCNIGAKYVRVIEEAFNRVDVEGYGVLNQVQMQQLWAIVFPTMSSKDVSRIADEIYQDLDPNHDGHVSWSEIENYFLGGSVSASGPSEVDRMLDDHLEEGEPTFRQAVWALVEIDAPKYTKPPGWLLRGKKWVSLISNLTIVVSIANFVIESLPSQYTERTHHDEAPFLLEAVCIAIFTIEFGVRWSYCPSSRDYWTSFYTWVDVLAILPFYVGAGFPTNPSGALVVLRVLRLLRLLRMLKLGRQFEAVQVLIIAIGRTIYPLMVSMLGVNSIAVTLFGSLITSAERYETEYRCPQPDGNWSACVNGSIAGGRYVRNPGARDWAIDAGLPIVCGQSIPGSMWWAWVTLTTVGYGDMFPVTPGGKAVASVTMVSGLVLMAFPLTLLASSFAETMDELRHKKCAKARGKAFISKLESEAIDPNATDERIDQAARSVLNKSGWFNNKPKPKQQAEPPRVPGARRIAPRDPSGDDRPVPPGHRALSGQELYEIRDEMSARTRRVSAQRLCAADGSPAGDMAGGDSFDSRDGDAARGGGANGAVAAPGSARSPAMAAVEVHGGGVWSPADGARARAAVATQWPADPPPDPPAAGALQLDQRLHRQERLLTDLAASVELIAVQLGRVEGIARANAGALAALAGGGPAALERQAAELLASPGSSGADKSGAGSGASPHRRRIHPQA